MKSKVTLKVCLISIFVLTFLGVMLSQAFNKPANAGNVVNSTITIPASVLPNPCNGEPVNLTGTIHVTMSSTTDKQGGVHLTYSANYQSVTGTGLLSGVKYTSSDNKNDSTYIHPIPAIYTTTHHVNLISSTIIPNFLLALDFHITINATGVLAASVDNLRLECK